MTAPPCKASSEIFYIRLSVQRRQLEEWSDMLSITVAGWVPWEAHSEMKICVQEDLGAILLGAKPEKECKKHDWAKRELEL